MSLSARTTVGILASGLLLVAADSVASAQTSGAAVSEGARVYGDMCGRCHNARSPLERSDREWVTVVNHMRVRGNLTGRQARRVLAFLQATNTDPRRPSVLPPELPPEPTEREVQPLQAPIPTDPEMVARGSRIAGEKACLGCHLIEGAGGRVGPDLDGVVQRRAAGFVRRKLADPTFNNPSSMMPNFGLNAEEIEALVAYLATLR